MLGQPHMTTAKKLIKLGSDSWSQKRAVTNALLAAKVFS